MGEVHKLTEFQVKALDYAEKTPAGRLSMFTPPSVVAALEEVKLTRHGKITKAGRAALARHRGETP